ncbi:hypothetical protein [Pseudomonas sp. MPB23]|uniref:hypothetical protein n=1 Tax=Pseudomonas sp. MPB23 TaxID=3388490 RepID=UPI0039847475
MSCHSINNIARVIDVRQVIQVDALKPSNETLQYTAAAAINQSTTDSCPHHGVKDSTGNSVDTLSLLSTLFASFLSQLINLVSDKKATIVPDVPPSPEVSPKVVPDLPAPKPDIAPSIPGLSAKRNGAKADNIWSGFRQGPDGNCVTVSAIKVAMHRFGQSPTDIFKTVTKTDGGYRVVMRDDFQLSLTDQELQQGARGSQFAGPDKGMLKDAQFLFAVSAKRAQMENNDRTAGRSFQAAIRSLNDGEDETGPGEGLQRLGLRKHMKRVSVRDLARGQLGMCNRTGHSVAVIDGREELWGRQGSAPTRGNAVALV